MRRAVFFDRDGVINRMWFDPEHGTVDSPANPDQFELLPRVASAVKTVNELGLLTVIVTNQPGIAKGKFTPALLAAMESKMHAQLAAVGAKVDAVYYCLHHPQACVAAYRAECECRKPRAGLLHMAARNLNIDLSKSYMLGDGVTDIVAGHRAGARTIFVSSRKCYMCDSLAEHEVRPDYWADGAYEAVGIIARLENGEYEAVKEFAATCESV